MEWNTISVDWGVLIVITMPCHMLLAAIRNQSNDKSYESQGNYNGVEHIHVLIFPSTIFVCKFLKQIRCFDDLFNRALHQSQLVVSEKARLETHTVINEEMPKTNDKINDMHNWAIVHCVVHRCQRYYKLCSESANHSRTFSRRFDSTKHHCH